MTPPIMAKDTRRFGVSIVLAAALFAACSKDAKKGPDSAALGADSSLNRDLAMANRDSAAKPELKDVPAPAAAPETRKRPEPRAHDARPSTPKPGAAATAPATTPSGNTVTKNPAGSEAANAGGAVGTIAAGTTLNLHSSDKVCTNTNAVGDHVTATLDGAVSGTNGATIPSGATVNMTVTQLKRSENSNDPIVIQFAVNSVTLRRQDLPARRLGTVRVDRPHPRRVEGQGRSEGRRRRRRRRDRRKADRQEHQGRRDRWRRGRRHRSRHRRCDGQLPGLHPVRRIDRRQAQLGRDSQGIVVGL